MLRDSFDGSVITRNAVGMTTSKPVPTIFFPEMLSRGLIRGIQSFAITYSIHFRHFVNGEKDAGYGSIFFSFGQVNIVGTIHAKRSIASIFWSGGKHGDIAILTSPLDNIDTRPAFILAGEKAGVECAFLKPPGHARVCNRFCWLLPE